MCVLQKSCVPGVRKSAGTLSTAIEFMEKTSTSFRLIRWVLTPEPDQWTSLCVQMFFKHFFQGRNSCFFLLIRYEHARLESVLSITTCGRSPSVTSTSTSRPPGSAERSSACSRGACECNWNTIDKSHSSDKYAGETGTTNWKINQSAKQAVSYISSVIIQFSVGLRSQGHMTSIKANKVILYFYENVHSKNIIWFKIYTKRLVLYVSSDVIKFSTDLELQDHMTWRQFTDWKFLDKMLTFSL